MAIKLNANSSFLDLDKDQQASFRLSPLPELVKFDEKDRCCLYKWTEFGLVNPTKPENPITEYWLPWTGFKLGNREVPGFKELRIRYRNIDGGVGRPQEFVRSRNAVSENTERGNAMSSILKVQLEITVWGFVGLTAAQPAYIDPKHPGFRANVTLIGGDYQLCIPVLQPGDLRKL